MDCFWCEIVKGDLFFNEYEAARWLKKTELEAGKWLPADIMLIDKIFEVM